LPQENINVYDDLYKIQIVCINYETVKYLKKDENLFFGFGLFLDNGEFYKLKNINDFLYFEKRLLQKHLNYSSSIGYGNNVNIQIGKNVYIHPSVILKEPIIIGNNCIIEANVEIQNSIISNNVHLKLGSVIKNSHISQDQKLLTDLYLDNKALFTAQIYDINSKQGYTHEGICAIHNLLCG
jgi:NDP-sugar pyrophosphorylase family protein